MTDTLDKGQSHPLLFLFLTFHSWVRAGVILVVKVRVQHLPKGTQLKLRLLVQPELKEQ